MSIERPDLFERRERYIERQKQLIGCEDDGSRVHSTAT